MREWIKRFLRMPSIGACGGVVFVAIAAMYIGFQDPDRMWNALSTNSPAPLIIVTIAITILSALGGWICYALLYFLFLSFLQPNKKQQPDNNVAWRHHMPAEIPETERREFMLETLSNVQASLSNTLLQLLQDKEARTFPDFDKDCLCVQSACRDTAFLLNQLVDGKDVENIRREFASSMFLHMSYLDETKGKKQYGKEQRILQAFQCMFTAVQQHDFYNLHNQQLHLPLTRQFEINGIAPSFHEARHDQ